MAKDNKQKIKLLVLLEMLRQDTDEDHPLGTGGICRRLGEQEFPVSGAPSAWT